MDAYDVIASYYDVEHSGLTADIEMYRQFAARNPGLILVAGVGTGRVALQLAAPAQAVWGIDNNDRMLSIARQRAGDMPGLTFVNADIRNFAHEKHFALILVPLDTFLSLESASGQADALEALRRHLDPGGLLMIDVVNPLTLPSEAEEGVVRQRYRGLLDGHALTIFDAVQVAQAAQEMEMHLTYDVVCTSGIVRETASLTIRWLYRFEMEHLCRLCGLEVTHIYGDYDLSPYESSSPRMIFVVTKLS